MDECRSVAHSISAWRVQIHLLKEHLVGFTGSIFFEFNIPRMGRRVDAVLVVDPVVFVVEFKADLCSFAATGHNRCIIPLKPADLGAWLAPGAEPSRYYELLDHRERPYCAHELAA